MLVIDDVDIAEQTSVRARHGGKQAIQIYILRLCRRQESRQERENYKAKHCELKIDSTFASLLLTLLSEVV